MLCLQKPKQGFTIKETLKEEIVVAMDVMRGGSGGERGLQRNPLNKGGFLTSIGFPGPEENSTTCDSLTRTTYQGWVELSLYSHSCDEGRDRFPFLLHRSVCSNLQSCREHGLI